VSNSLVAYQESHEGREEKAAQVASAADAVRLARLRYSRGNTSYLEVLTTDTELYDAQLRLAQVQESEAVSLVSLYAALGRMAIGGARWLEKAPAEDRGEVLRINTDERSSRHLIS